MERSTMASIDSDRARLLRRHGRWLAAATADGTAEQVAKYRSLSQRLRRAAFGKIAHTLFEHARRSRTKWLNSSPSLGA
jgi:hypothetical protein